MRATQAILQGAGRSAYKIGPDNPLLGQRVRVTWLRPWSGKPEGHEIDGILRETYTPNGRAMLGVVSDTTGRKLLAPWSKRFVRVVVLPRGDFAWPEMRERERGVRALG